MEPLETRLLLTIYTVASLEPDGAGSLAAAVAAANGTDGADVIEFQLGLAGTITLSRTLVISDALDVRGPGAAALTLHAPTEADGGDRVIHIEGSSSVSVRLAGLKITAGDYDSGGAGIFNDGAHLTIEDAVISGNHSNGTAGGGIWNAAGTLIVRRCTIIENLSGNIGGGGIYSEDGTLTIEDSRLSDNLSASNVAGATGGGVSIDGGSATIRNSTFSGNSEGDLGGGGAIGITDATVLIQNSTIAYNRTADRSGDGPGGGIYVSSGTLTLHSTLIANNRRANGDTGSDLARASGATIHASNSLIERSDAGTVNGTDMANVFGDDPALVALVDNGGPTLTFGLEADSPAVNAGSNPAELSYDQRGPGFSRVSGAAADIGAYERAVSTSTPNPTPTPTPTPIDDDRNDEIPEAEAVSNGTFDGRIEAPTDVDLFKFDVPSGGRRYTFDIDTEENGSPGLGSYLRLLDSAGNQLASNNDARAPGESRLGYDAFIAYTFNSAGTYYIGVSTYRNTTYNVIDGGGDNDNPLHGSGDYVLVISADAPPVAGGDGYADRVVHYFDSGAGPVPGPYGDIRARPGLRRVSADVVLGGTTVADFLSLPMGSFIVVQFVDESIIDGPGNDLIVREQDDVDERAEVSVSADGKMFMPVGIAAGGASSAFDLGLAGVAGPIRFVKILGLDNYGSSPGFDLLDLRVAPGSMGPGSAVAPPIVPAEQRVPVLVVPGIVGSMPALGSLPNFLIKGTASGSLAPNELVIDPFLQVYDAMLATFTQLGYEKDKDLFAAAYDWRLPITARPDGNRDGIVSIPAIDDDPSTFHYGVEYLAAWIDEAQEQWAASHSADEAFHVDVVAHSMGGLLTRAFMQSADYQQKYPGVIRNVVTVGTPHQGAVDSYLWLAPGVGVDAAIDDAIALGTAALTGHISTTAALKIIIDMMKAAGVVGALAETFVPSLSGMLPTFPAVGSGTFGTPPAKERYANELLLDLNADATVWSSAATAAGGHIHMIAGTGVETAASVRYVLGPVFTVQTSGAGDGTVLTDSATLGGAGGGVGTPHAVNDVEHLALMENAAVQREIIVNELGIQVPAGFEPAQPESSTVRGLTKFIMGWLDPVDFQIIDAAGRRFGSVGDHGYVNEIPGAFYSGNGEFEYFVIPVDEQTGDLQLRLVGEPERDYAGGIIYNAGGGVTEVRTFDGTLANGSVREMTIAEPKPQALIPTLAVADASAGEAEGTLTFTVTLNNPAAHAVSVDYATADETAVGGADYVPASGTVTIPVGQTSATVSVSVIDDLLPEPEKRFVISLSNPTNATIEAGHAAGRIVSNDPGPSLIPALAPGKTPASAIGGGKGVATMIITNGGDAAFAGTATVSLRASADDILDSADSLLATLSKKLKLKPGQSKLVKAKFVYPSDLDGTFSLLTLVDAAGMTGNGVQSAAPVTVTIARPHIDLTGTWSVVPPAVTHGNRANAAVNVQNIGNMPAKTISRIALFASQDDVLDASDVTLGTIDKRLNLKSGGSKAVRFNLTVPIDLLAGSFRLLASIDPLNAVPESNDANNIVVSDGTTTFG